MNKIKTFFANRKFSPDRLLQIIFNITAFIGLIVAFVVIDRLAKAYPTEAGVCIVCAIFLTLGGLAVIGLIDVIFPKKHDSETDDWLRRARAELKKHKKYDESN